MEEKLTVSEVKKIVTGIAGLGNVADAVFEDGKVSGKDFKHLPALVRATKVFAKVDYKLALPQIKDMDEAEKVDLSETLRTVFDIKADAMEEAIEEGFDILLEAIGALVAVVEFRKKLKS